MIKIALGVFYVESTIAYIVELIEVSHGEVVGFRVP
ncbi:hypothetical protein V1283_002370 [Bradyrhizobium sp. AZCC 2262]